LFFTPFARLELDAMKYIQLRKAKVLQFMKTSMAPKVTIVDSEEGLENEIQNLNTYVLNTYPCLETEMDEYANLFEIYG